MEQNCYIRGDGQVTLVGDGQVTLVGDGQITIGGRTGNI